MRKVTPQNQNTTVINERSGQNSRDQFELNRTNTRIENLAPPPVIIDDLGNRNVQEMLQNLQALRDQAPRAEVNIQRAEQARMGALQVVNDINALMNSYIPYGSFVFWSSLTVAGGYLLYNFNPLRAISWVRRNMRGGVNLIQNTNINPDPNSLSQVHLRNIVQDFNRNPSYYASFVIMMAAIRRFFIR